MKVGVVIGRFQVHKLHDGHLDLIKKVAEQSDSVCILVGVSENRSGHRHPLDFITRKLMIEQSLATLNKPLTILPIHDESNDETWAKNVDSLLKKTFLGADITLYDGSDGFSRQYSGRGSLRVEHENIAHSARGTQLREQIASQPLSSEEFRRGVIYGVINQWDRVFPTVDVVLMSNDGQKFYVGKKKGETKLRFIGGFVDCYDNSLEDAVRREAREEAEVNLQYVTYISSRGMYEYRYTGGKNGSVMTSFFLGLLPELQNPHPSDDIDEIVEISREEIKEAIDEEATISLKFVENHRPLLQDLAYFLKDKE